MHPTKEKLFAGFTAFACEFGISEGELAHGVRSCGSGQMGIVSYWGLNHMFPNANAGVLIHDFHLSS